LWCYTNNPKKSWDRCDPLTADDFPKDDAADKHNEAAAKAKAAAEKAAAEKKAAEEKAKKEAEEAAKKAKEEAEAKRKKAEEDKKKRREKELALKAAKAAAEAEAKQRAEEERLKKEAEEKAKKEAEAAKAAAEAKAKAAKEAAEKANKVFRIPGCEYTEFTERGDKFDYRGCQSRTKGGYTCQPWNTDSPNKRGGSYKRMYEKKTDYIGDHNYCRSAKWGALWCYTNNPRKNWDVCDPETAESFAANPPPPHAPGCAASE